MSPSDALEYMGAHPYQGIAFFFLMYFIHLKVYYKSPIPEELEWVGTEGRIWFARTRASLNSVFGNKDHLDEGVRKFLKYNKAFVLPNLLTGPEVILPRSQTQWLLDQPTSILSQAEASKHFLEADYTLLRPEIVRDTVHVRLIRRDLTEQLESLTSDIVEEIQEQIDKSWGLDTKEWKEVGVYDTMSKVIHRATNRILVGRDASYFHDSSKVFKYLLFTAAAINLLPRALKLILAPLFTFYDKFYYWKCAKKTIPLIQQRMKAAQEAVTHPAYVNNEPEPNDYIQWAVKASLNQPDALERSPAMILKRLAVLGFAAIATTALTITATLFDLASSALAKNYFWGLQNEVESVLAQNNGVWSKQGLNKMIRVDSALKESLRMAGVSSRGVMKKVVNAEGVDLPGGIHLPCGVGVGVSSYTVHHDESVYSRPNTYDAFRFLQGTETMPLDSYSHKQANQPSVGPTAISASLARTSKTFMAFSHGRHACPGRFLAANQLKLILAYIALSYEIEPVPERTPDLWFVHGVIPPVTATLRVRRRPERRG